MCFYAKLINSSVQELRLVKNFNSEVTILIPKTILPHLTVFMTVNSNWIVCVPRQFDSSFLDSFRSLTVRSSTSKVCSSTVHSSIVRSSTVRSSTVRSSTFRSSTVRLAQNLYNQHWRDLLKSFENERKTFKKDYLYVYSSYHILLVPLAFKRAWALLKRLIYVQ